MVVFMPATVLDILHDQHADWNWPTMGIGELDI